MAEHYLLLRVTETLPDGELVMLLNHLRQQGGPAAIRAAGYVVSAQIVPLDITGTLKPEATNRTRGQ